MSKEGPTVILCGTDFTPHAAEAAEVASAFSLRTGEPLVLVHALEEVGAEAAIEKLRAEAERLRALFPGLHVEIQIQTGNADEVLAGLARLFTVAWAQGEQSARLVIVSTLGRRAPARWILGSVAERTAQMSPVPVLVVRDKHPFVSWLRGERRLRVVVGYDFSETSTPALRWVSDLGRIAPCDIIVGHVTWPPEELKRQGAHWAVGAHKNFPKLEVLLKSDLSRRLREHLWKDGPPSLRIKLSSGRRAITLAELAAEEKADLLVVGSRQVHGPSRLWQESVSRGVLYHAQMSVACVPSPAFSEHAKPPAPERPVDEDDTDLVRKLEAHPFLRGVSGEVLRRLATISREETFAQGAVLLREGSEADTVFLLERGLVALELNVPGKGPARLESLRGGDIVGLSWLFPPYRWHLDAKAVEPTTVLAIDARRLREWMKEDAETGQAVTTRLVGQLYERLERVRMQRLDLYKAES
ncbi:MAG: universal stress protein [Planctomycetes bacterium]|nr:universal stress protein [Planctomycetota bacterium]